jgi:hypothetical protein
MKFSHLNRRLHLYLGLSLLPWFVIYGVSSIPFSHPPGGRPEWTPRFERPYELPVAPTADLREIGRAIVRDARVEGAYGAYRSAANRINVYVHTFWTATQITFDAEKKILKAEDRGFRWNYFLTGLHARGGFQQENILEDAWAVLVDIVSFGFILWVLTGLYMWWTLPGSRAWGAMALLAGIGSFGVFLWLM